MGGGGCGRGRLRARNDQNWSTTFINPSHIARTNGYNTYHRGAPKSHVGFHHRTWGTPCSRFMPRHIHIRIYVIRYHDYSMHSTNQSSTAISTYLYICNRTQLTTTQLNHMYTLSISLATLGVFSLRVDFAENPSCSFIIYILQCTPHMHTETYTPIIHKHTDYHAGILIYFCI